MTPEKQSLKTRILEGITETEEKIITVLKNPKQIAALFAAAGLLLTGFTGAVVADPLHLSDSNNNYGPTPSPIPQGPTNTVEALPNGVPTAGSGSPTGGYNQSSSTPSGKGRTFTENVAGKRVKFTVDPVNDTTIDLLRFGNNTTVVEPTDIKAPEGNDAKKYAAALTDDLVAAEGGQIYSSFPSAKQAEKEHLTGTFWDKRNYAHSGDRPARIYESFINGTLVGTSVDVSMLRGSTGLDCEFNNGQIIQCHVSPYVPQTGLNIPVDHFNEYEGALIGDTTSAFKGAETTAVKVPLQFLNGHGRVHLNFFTSNGDIIGASERVVALASEGKTDLNAGPINPNNASPATPPAHSCSIFGECGVSVGTCRVGNPSEVSLHGDTPTWTCAGASNGAASYCTLPKDAVIGAERPTQDEDNHGGVILHYAETNNTPADKFVIGVASSSGTVKPKDVFSINETDFSRIGSREFIVGCLKTAKGQFQCRSVPRLDDGPSDAEIQNLPLYASDGKVVLGGPLPGLQVIVFGIANANSPVSNSPSDRSGIGKGGSNTPSSSSAAPSPV